MTRQEFDLGPLRDMTWLQLDGGFLYGAHEVADHDTDNDGDYAAVSAAVGFPRIIRN